MHHSVPSASVSMCQMRSARSVGAYSSIPSGCSRTWPSESTKSSGAVVVIDPPGVRSERDPTLEEPANESLLEVRVRGVDPLGVRSDVEEHAAQVTRDRNVLGFDVVRCR